MPYFFRFSALSILCITLTSSLSLSAPLPATSTSSIISKERGLFFSELGFKMNAGKTDWLLTPTPSGSKYMVTLYKSPKAYKGTQASLSVRLDRLKEKQDLEQYVQKWLRKYPRFGFEVLGAQNFSNKGQKGYVVDLVHKEKSKQLRQAIFMQANSAIVMTCRDHRENFKNSLRNCNSIIRSFKWTK